MSTDSLRQKAIYGLGSVVNPKTTYSKHNTCTNPLKTHKILHLLAAAKGMIAMIGCGSDIVDRHTQSLASQRPVLL